ncbi:type VII secretion integral membrane protein EccD [Mycobacterium sp. DSM 3803]|nr:type VII secretion integral membrane protein EccD [Mycobacterium sp. DSM 3803]
MTAVADPQAEAADREDRGAAAEPSQQVTRVRIGLMVAGIQIPVVLDAISKVSQQVPALVDLANVRLDEIGRPRLKPAGGYAEHDRSKPVRGRWALCWVDGTPLHKARSLAEQGVVDGMKLWLQFVDDTEVRTPVIENVTTLVAAEFRKRWPAITATAAARIGVGMLATGVGLMLVLLLRWRYGHEGFTPALIAAVVGFGLLVASTVVAMRTAWSRRDVSSEANSQAAQDELATEIAVGDVLRLTGAATIALAAALAIPGPLGAPHAGLGAGVAVAAAAMIARYTGRHIALCTTVIVLGTAVVVTGVARMVLVTSAVILLTCVLLVAMIGLKCTASIARAASGAIQLPVMPAPGRPFMFENRPYLPNEVVVASGEALTLEGAESLRRVEVGRARAHAYITGLLSAWGILLIVTCVGLCDPHAPRRWLMVALAAVVATAVLLWGRTYTDRWQSAILAVSAVTIAATVTVRYVVQLWSLPALVIGCAVLVVVPACGLIAAVIVPRSVYTPVFKQVVEIAEYMLLTAVFPLSFWVMDVFAAIRFRS